MFKTAATKIAHNSTIPALGGNRDLRPLQDLITAEKAVLISLQKLSVDYSKASEALRTWGLSEGDDLGDILSASTTILNHFSSALSQYAAHGHAMRDQLKAIRSREEALEDLKRRRRTVVKRAEDAERKLAKMSPENKNLQMQTETLNRLRDEIRTMDSDIMSEEAALGDFKRTATRMWMGLKFGGLLECSEKGTIAGEFGKLIISEISEEVTQPGLPRSLYYGQNKTESLVAEAYRCINEIAMSTVPSVGFRDRRQYDNRGQEGSHPGGAPPWSPNDSKPMPQPPLGRESFEFTPPARQFGNEGPGSPATGVGGSYANNSYHTQQPSFMSQGQGSAFSQTMPMQLQQPSQQSQQSVDDFGVPTRSAGLMPDTNPAGGRFATFPVKTRPQGAIGGYSLQDPPSLASRQEMGPSFADSIQEALDSPTSAMGPSETAKQFGGRSGSPTSLPLPPPPGAAPPSSNPWADAELTAPAPMRNVSRLSDNDDALLAYMTAADEAEDSPSPTTKKTFQGPKGAAPPDSEDGHKASQHVRFGEVEDINNEMGKRVSLEKDHQAGQTADHASGPAEAQRRSNEQQRNANDDPFKPTIGRVPPPTISTEDDEKALNAAAAREITRELEALKTDLSSPTEPRGRFASTYSEYSNREPSPLSPPSAPFTKRSVSPHPYAKLDVNVTASNPYGSQFNSPTQPYAPHTASPAQAYAQSYQHQPQEIHTPTASVPPRFQALHQGQDPGSPTGGHQVPPRFQAGGTSQIPPPIILPEHQDPRFSPPKALGTETPYRTPPEYPNPRSLGASSAYTKSNTSLNSGMMTPPAPGAKTISAAAFKRPRNASTDILPDPFTRKGLPGSPYPVREPSGLGPGSVHPAGAASGGPALGAPPPRHSVAASEDEYDYINAYVNSAPSSPMRGEFGNEAEPVNRAGVGAGASALKGPVGYSNGRFSTELDDLR